MNHFKGFRQKNFFFFAMQDSLDSSPPMKKVILDIASKAVPVAKKNVSIAIKILSERDVGIKSYMSNGPSFTGIIKHRYFILELIEKI